LLFGNTQTHAVNPNLMDPAPYDAVKDFTSVARLFNTGTILVVSSSLPVNSLDELLAWIKANPKRANFGSTAYGTVSHLPSAYWSKVVGVPLTHVPYNNAGQLMTDLARGEVTLLFYPPDGVKAFIEAGTLKPLAWSGNKRHPHYAQVPTMIELGYKDFVFEAWYALFAPAGTPAAVINRLNEALVKVVKEPKFVQDVAAGSSVLYFAEAAEMDAFLKAENNRFKRIATLIDKP
jgi:tripartite-type tricarboxylate transporter receptor subunit TctC